MSGWVAPVVASIMSMARQREEETTRQLKSSEAVRVRYEKRVKIPASYYYASDEFEVIPTADTFQITPKKVDVPAEQVTYTIIEQYPSLDDAPAHVVQDKMVLVAVGFQHRLLDGGWDNCWQEVNLSKLALQRIEIAERELKEKQ